jgi:hypothetical protein
MSQAPNYEAALAKATEELVEYESGHCTYDGWSSTACCTAWMPALKMYNPDRQEFEQIVRSIADAAVRAFDKDAS